jgi:hypothetical protein
MYDLALTQLIDSDGFFGEDNSGKSRFDLLLDSATDAVQWISDQTTRLEGGDE